METINLKEAFRFQNVLDGMLNSVSDCLMNPLLQMTVENTMMRSKVMPDAEDETTVEDVASSYQPYVGQVDKLMLFAAWLIDEKCRLANAIQVTKTSLPINMDAEIAINRNRQMFSRLFSNMARLRDETSVKRNRGTGYRFDVNGNQVVYACDVRRVATVNFDRTLAKKLSDKLSSNSDSISTIVDECMVNAKVEYKPPFSANDVLEDVFGMFLAGDLG